MEQLAGHDPGHRAESLAGIAHRQVGTELRRSCQVFWRDCGDGREAIRTFRGEEAGEDLREIVAVDPASTIAVVPCGQKARIGHVDHLCRCDSKWLRAHSSADRRST